MPDAEKWFAFFDGLYDLYRQSGPAPAPTAQPFHPPPRAPAISVSTNPGLVDKLSVPLSTRTVISRLSTGSIIAHAPHEVLWAAPATLTFRRSACRAEPAARSG